MGCWLRARADPYVEAMDDAASPVAPSPLPNQPHAQPTGAVDTQSGPRAALRDPALDLQDDPAAGARPETQLSVQYVGDQRHVTSGRPRRPDDSGPRDQRAARRLPRPSDRYHLSRRFGCSVSGFGRPRPSCARVLDAVFAPAGIAQRSTPVMLSAA